MPTLFRFLAVIAVLGGLGLAAMVALVAFVEPHQREISITIPPNQLGR